MLFLDFHPLKLLADLSPAQSSGFDSNSMLWWGRVPSCRLCPCLLFRLFSQIRFLWPQKNQASFLPRWHIYFSHLRSNFSIHKYPNLILPMPTSLPRGKPRLACIQHEHLPLHQLTASWVHLFQASSWLSTHIPICCPSPLCLPSTCPRLST